MKKIALNYIYLSRNHAGGKDQVGLNLLKGFYESGISNQMIMFCYDYSANIIKNIAPDIKIYLMKSPKAVNEFVRLLNQTYLNTVVLPKIIKQEKIECIFHLALNNGLRRFPCRTILLPHDIKQIAHRKIGSIKTPLYKYLLYRIMYSLDFKHADQIIAISNCDKKEMYKFYPQYRKKIVRIYNPIVFQELKSADPMVAFPYIIGVNLQFLHKNIITLIKAYEKIQNRIEQKLVLVGNVPKRVNFLKEYVSEHHLEDRVLFTGLVREDELHRWMANADLYVNPTLYEGFGMTAVEAMLLKVPTLVSKIPVNYEVTKGLCDYYEPAEDAERLAEKIFNCLGRKKDMNELNRKRTALNREYNYRVICEQYRKLFYHMDTGKNKDNG